MHTSIEGNGLPDGTPDIERRALRVWAVLVLIPAISIGAYLTGVRPLALLAAAIVVPVSVYVAATRFMHIDLEPRFVAYLAVTVTAFMGLLFFLVAPDVMVHEGQHWENVAAKRHVVHAEPHAR